jgi:two-component system sensor kinase FixL
MRVNGASWVARLRAAWRVLRELPARPRGLRVQMVAMLLIALVPAVLAQVIGGRLLARDFEAAHLRGLGAIAGTVAAAVDRKLARATTVADHLAHGEWAAGEDALPELQRRALGALERVGDEGLIWRDDGTPEPGALLTRFPALVDPASVEAARRAARDGVTVRSFHDTGVIRGDVFVPVPRAGAVRGVIEISVTPPGLTDLLTRILQGERAGAILIGPEGRVIARSGNAVMPIAGPPPDWLWRGAAAGTSGTLDGDALGHDTLLAAFATPENAPSWRVLIVETPEIIGSTLRRPFELMIAATAISILIGVAAALLLGGRIVRSLRQLTLAAQAVAAGSESLAYVPGSLVSEFNELRNGVARADAVLRRRAAAERLALQEARTGHELLASVVNGTADLIYVKDLDLRFVLVNQAALRAAVIGREEWQVLGRRSSDIAPPEFADRSEELDREVLATGEVRRGRFNWARADGSPGTFTLTKSPWCDVAGQIAGVVSVAHDITDQRLAEQRVATVQGELLRATRLSAMGAMASGLAHELNQPLAAATNFLNATARMLARDPLGETDLRLVRKAVTDAVEQTLRAGQIVRRLRGFVGRGESDMHIENVGDIVREIQRVACADGAIDNRLQFVSEGDDSSVALVERTQIQQVLLNLIKNASEAIGDAPGGRIELGWRRVRDTVEITVADNGPGFAQDIRDRLFQPFTSTKALGMGIGLAICRTIVEGHGGTLDAEDRPTGGVLFRITLPPVTGGAGNDTGMEGG